MNLDDLMQELDQLVRRMNRLGDYDSNAPVLRQLAELMLAAANRIAMVQGRISELEDEIYRIKQQQQEDKLIF